MLRPTGGSTVATASANIGSSSVGLKYTTTAADLATPGDWTCRIFNASLIASTFTTRITSSASPAVVDYPIKTASFDIALLGNLLQEAANTAALRVHLEASGDGSKKSVVSWSVPVANLIDGSTDSWFHIDDVSKSVTLLNATLINATFRLLNLNSDPAGLSVGVSTDPLAITATLGFDAGGALLKSETTGVPDGTFDLFQITLTVNFDGTIVPECNVKATINIASFEYDVSSDVKSNVESHIADMIFSNYLSPPWS